MTNRISVWVPRVVLAALLAVVFTLASSASASAAPITDADLRGYKGGLVEVGLKGGATVRGMLYGYTSEHVELEIAGGRTVKVHRSRLLSLKSAPAGASSSVSGAFPRDAGMPYSAAAPRATPTPPPTAATPPAGTGSTPPEAAPIAAPASGPNTVPSSRASKPKGLAFELKLGGALYMPQAVSYYHPVAPVSADVMVGYKLGRFIMGMRMDFSMAETGDGGDVGRIWMVVFAPTVQFSLFDSWPLSLYGSVSFDIGPGVISTPGASDDKAILVGFRAGAGIRYFFHPRFAIGAETGFRGLWILEEIKIGLVTVYGQASLLFIL